VGGFLAPLPQSAYNGNLLLPPFSPVIEMPGPILVVDDEPMVRARITRVLTDAGYEVVSVADGRAAIDAARGAEVPFNLVITNILHVDLPV